MCFFSTISRVAAGVAASGGAWYGTVVTFVPSPKGGRHADLTLAGFPWPSSVAGLRSRVSRWSPAAQQGPPVSGRPAANRGDHRGHALLRRRLAHRAGARADRRAVARRSSY